MKKKTWKIIFIISLLIFLVSAGVCGYYIYTSIQEQKAYEELQVQVEKEKQAALEAVKQQDYTAREGDAPVIPEDVFVDEEESKAPDIDVNIENPIDFEELRGINEDLYAWVRITDTNIDYPVAQHSEEDDFYLHHNMYKEPKSSGCIYSEKANARDFSDPVTIFYGHNMRNGSMFQNLHKFEDKEFFDAHPYIHVYTPEGTLVYEIVSAGVTDNKHILNYYDFEDEAVFAEYLENMKSVKSMGTHIREDVELTEESKVLILSTCVGGNANARYIVQAVMVFDGREYEEE